LGTEINLTTKIKRKAKLVAEKMGDDVVMMGMESGRYYKLNPTAARIWEIIEEETTPSEVVENLLSEYDISEEVCKSEVLDILTQFRREKIIDVIK
jgi:hypothetical protein